MVETTPLAPPSIPSPASSVGGTTAAPAAVAPTADEADRARQRSNNNNNNTNNKPREKFKGTVEKMHGHVFQMAGESHKPDQYTKTIEALAKYAAIELKPHGKDLVSLFANPPTEPVLITPPDMPPIISGSVATKDAVYASPQSGQHIAWTRKWENFSDQEIALEANKHSLFGVILSQCSPSVINKLKANSDFSLANSSDDVRWLLVTVKQICHSFNDTENRFVGLINAKKAILNHHQGDEQPTTVYYEVMMTLVDILESYGGQVHDPFKAIPDDWFKATATDAEKTKAMRDLYVAALIIYSYC
jgi:hypothetical protein